MRGETSQNEYDQQVLLTSSRFTNNTIWCHPAYGPSFGGNLNIFISSNSNKNRKSSINYRCPLTCRLLSFGFSISDIEVFHNNNYYFLTLTIIHYFLKMSSHGQFNGVHMDIPYK